MTPDSSADMLGNEMNTGEAESVDRGTHGVPSISLQAHYEGIIPGTIRFSLSQGTNSG